MLAVHLPFDTSRLRETTGVVRALQERMLLLIPLLSGLGDRMQALKDVRDARVREGKFPLIVSETMTRLFAGLAAAKSAPQRLGVLAGFRPAMPVPEGIGRFVAWYRDYYGK